MFDETQSGIGGGGFTLNNSSSDWISIEVPIEYSIDKVPSYAYIQFALLDSSDNDLTTIGSTVKIDHLSLEGAVTSVALNDNTPLTFALDQNYPNPFNPSTIISYALPQASHVTIKIYDMLGREIKTLVNSEQNAGILNIQWNGDNNFGSKVSTGAYIYMIQAGDFFQAKKMILLK